MSRLGRLVLAILVCASGRCLAAEPLVIGTDATYPPLEFMEGSEFTGFDIDLGNAIAREMGRTPQWVNCGFDGILAALESGKFDLVMSALTITDERKRSLAFSDPYYTAGQALACRKDRPNLKGIEDLKGATVGIQINTTAKEVLRERPDIRMREYNSIDLALLDLQNGNIDAVMTDLPVLRYMLRRSFDSLRLTGTLLTEERYGIAARKDRAALIAEVNAAMARLEARGIVRQLHAKWFGEDETVTPASRRDLLGIIVPSLARAALVTLQLTFLSLILGLPIGLLIALMRISRRRWISLPAVAYVEVLRGTPLLVQLFAIYYVLPSAGIQLGQWPAALLAFTLNSSAYVAEIFRAGILSLDIGQMEAARSLGMSYGMAMRLVILPQAVHRVLPPLTNEAIALLKDTSLVSVIAMVELTRQGQQLTGSLAVPMLVWPLVGAFYLAMTLPLTRLAAALERRWQTK
ncbi:MAG: ABC transporter permease subunit [Chthonomonadales bacterium]|nr:ABC transporter permease subunit [Chthonomonadales bacterium]